MDLSGQDGAVLVLGDIGRSPRMQYQALSLSKNGARIALIGYRGSQAFSDVLMDKNITLYFLPEWVYRPKSRIMFLASLPFRIVFEYLVILYTLVWLIPRPSFILVQNPPSIPSLIVAKIASLIFGAHFIIDWHNFGFTILGLRLGRSHLFVKIAYAYEQLCGRMADQSICVTRAMQKELGSNWNIQASVLHDRPPAKFCRLTLDKIHEFFVNFHKSGLLDQASDWLPPLAEIKKQTIITEKADGIVRYRADRPAVIVTSTSYTPDENIGMLLDALLMYDRNHTASDLRCLVIITGKGPLMEFYSKEIALLNLNHVKVIQVWLSADDYPKILGCADLGVSLHVSSSGLDLPMKIVDMFGSGLPVCAVGFPCLDELVAHRKNGLVFHSSAELKQQLSEILKNDSLLSDMRHALNQFISVRWDDCWNQNALPCFIRAPKPSAVRLYIMLCLLTLLGMITIMYSL